MIKDDSKIKINHRNLRAKEKKEHGLGFKHHVTICDDCKHAVCRCDAEKVKVGVPLK